VPLRQRRVPAPTAPPPSIAPRPAGRLMFRRRTCGATTIRAPRPSPCCSKGSRRRRGCEPILDPAELKTSDKPTVNDIARVAGVSLATVDRVLNARPGVRSVTVEKVQRAIAELGYVRDTAAANLARRRVYNLLFVLPATDNEFVLALHDQIREQR